MRKSYVQINGVLYEKGTEPVQALHYVMPDKVDYTSMVDGSRITSRRQHQEHLRRHNCVEVGNEVKSHLSHYERVRKEVDAKQKESRIGVLRAQFDAMRHSDFKAMQKRDLDRIRWNSRKD